VVLALIALAIFSDAHSQERFGIKLICDVIWSSRLGFSTNLDENL
jgi:hypothetical protein